ncbi:helix-turn-helix domain-containing protein [uncultured Tateyamaria sp.]|uniref:helix-turn-helix domain-containing protein n=1 Tax=uncultured Tateyamaria sp. TaxID=455651 RepID=UPI002623ED32|nr:helix-turn-helix transcriptional regulator [uncultured Tateyamaria sp.]
MAREGLTGTRIRERRVMAGVKQANLARQIGISASYLNLIEHNRRRIGGKLLLDIAGALGVEASALTEGAEAALIATLREAAQGTPMAEVEVERAEEFAGRFPGWADALAASHRKVAALERTVESLSDRLAHDPELAASVHEVLSTAAAIRSTASILAEDKDLDPEWRDRFHVNIDADSRRLAESSKTLVGFLDAETGDAAAPNSAQEDVEAFLEANDYAFPELEAGRAAIEDVVRAAPELTSVAARHIAHGVLTRVSSDAARVAMADLRAALADAPPDPLALARRFGVSVPCILRRLSAVPGLACGLVVADRAGSLLFRKGIPGFIIPRYGSACPLWPLFQALGQPGQVLFQRVRMPGRSDAVFDCYAASETLGPVTLNAPPLAQSTMLMLPVPEMDLRGGPEVRDVGGACRICPVQACAGRREPSILSDGF